MLIAQRRLIDVEAEDVVRVHRVRLGPTADPRCRKMDLHTGEILRCLENAQGAVLLLRGNGRRILLPDACARSVMVQPAEEEHETSS